MDMEKKGCAFLAIALGFWMIALPLTFEFHDIPLLLSDLCSGLALIILGVFALKRRWAGLVLGAIGIWLQLAPLIFWARSPAHYLNDTLIGVILICLSFTFISGVQFCIEETGPQKPKGWSYNPSSWKPRLITVGLALVCWSISRYLAAYQLGYIDVMWDPVFDQGTLRVITSQISHDFPVSDAGLGAFGYTLESLLGWHGSSRRWYRMPWLVLAFGVMVVPVGLISIILIILQPVVVGAWCFWCLLTAACMLGMILLSGSELIATLVFLRDAVRQGAPLWKVIWQGGEPGFNDATTISRQRTNMTSGWGFTLPWNLVLLVLAGAYLMLSPYLFSVRGDLATIQYVLGPLMVTFAIVSMVEVYRVARFVNILFGIILLIAPFFGSASFAAANWNAAVIGLIAIGLALRKGLVRERYGSWNRFIF